MQAMSQMTRLQPEAIHSCARLCTLVASLTCIGHPHESDAGAIIWHAIGSLGLHRLASAIAAAYSVERVAQSLPASPTDAPPDPPDPPDPGLPPAPVDAFPLVPPLPPGPAIVPVAPPAPPSGPPVSLVPLSPHAETHAKQSAHLETKATWIIRFF